MGDTLLKGIAFVFLCHWPSGDKSRGAGQSPAFLLPHFSSFPLDSSVLGFSFDGSSRDSFSGFRDFNRLRDSERR